MLSVVGDARKLKCDYCLVRVINGNEIEQNLDRDRVCESAV